MSSDTESDESEDLSHSDASWEDRDHVTNLLPGNSCNKEMLRKRLSTVSEEFGAEV